MSTYETQMRTLQALQVENATLKEQVAQLQSTIHHAAQMTDMDKETIEQQAAVIKQLQKYIQIAAEQIRKCDYTPARSTLLCVMKDFK